MIEMPKLCGQCGRFPSEHPHAFCATWVEKSPQRLALEAGRRAGLELLSPEDRLLRARADTLRDIVAELKKFDANSQARILLSAVNVLELEAVIEALKESGP